MPKAPKLPRNSLGRPIMNADRRKSVQYGQNSTRQVIADAERPHNSSFASSSNQGSSLEVTEPLYYVERILDKRINNGKNEYFVKWLNYGLEDNTWEPEENMNCDQLIAEYEEKYKPVTIESAKTPQSNTVENGNIENTVPKNNDDDNRPISPIDNIVVRDANDLVLNSLVPERIIGAINHPDGMLFLVKWMNREKADLVASDLAKDQFPQVVIEFYQRNFRLVDPSGSTLYP